MKDYLLRGIEKNGKFKFVGAKTTEIVNEAKVQHNTSATASAALGRTLTAGALMSTMLKNKDDSLTLIISGNGPGGNILVSANNKGELKGYIDNPSIDLEPNKNSKLDVSGIVGNVGYIKTIMDLGMKEPYVGQSEIISGEIAEDIANYYLTSEQINTAVALGVLVDTDLTIINSGGYLIQLMPDATDEDITKLENAILNKPSLTEMMNDYDNFEDLLKYLLEDFEIEILEKKDIMWVCNCSKEKTIEMLKTIGAEELESIIEEDGKAEVVCQFCNEKYNFNKDELTEILSEVKEKHTNE